MSLIHPIEHHSSCSEEKEAPIVSIRASFSLSCRKRTLSWTSISQARIVVPLIRDKVDDAEVVRDACQFRSFSHHQ